MSMSNTNCQAFQDLLVDYSDGELSQVEASNVRMHLESCPACRAELGKLNSSLSMLKSYWDNLSVSAVPARTTLGAASARLPKHFSIATVAASLLLLVVGASISQSWKPWLKDYGHKQSKPSSDSQQLRNSSAHNEPTTDALIAMITRDSQRARLQATIEILQSEPGLQDRVKHLQQQLADTNRW
jgi:anti-sigma factor RsiW